jgi:glutathione synthase
MKQVLFVLDPLSTLDKRLDTSLFLMQAAFLQEVEVWVVFPDEVFFQQVAYVTAYPVRFRTLEFWDLSLGLPQLWEVSQFSQVWFRMDPPVNERYCALVQILAASLSAKQLVNPAEVLLLHSEKTLGLGLQSGSSKASDSDSCEVPTLITCSEVELLWFLKEHRAVVVKPLNMAQSLGVKKLEWKPRSKGLLKQCVQTLQEATCQWQVPICLQKFLPQISQGEVRLWFADDRLIGVARKLPLKDSFLVQIDQGSQVVDTDLTTAQDRLMPKIQRRIRELGIRVCAVDLIENYVTDFNVTSPGLLVQMSKLVKKNLAAQVIRKVITNKRW